MQPEMTWFSTGSRSEMETQVANAHLMRLQVCGEQQSDCSSLLGLLGAIDSELLTPAVKP